MSRLCLENQSIRGVHVGWVERSEPHHISCAAAGEARCARLTLRLRYGKRRRGLTFIELIIASAILVLVAGTLQTLAKAVHDAAEHNQRHGLATQHARVVLDRIATTVSQATANEQFPGLLVVAERSGSWSFPDTLVVWRPSGSPANPSGLPRFCELVFYFPSPSIPSQLLEVTVPTDTRTVPATSDQASWLTEVTRIKRSPPSTTVVLTDLLQTCSTSATADANWRGAVRFDARLRPSDSDWALYKSGSLTWKQLPWVQGIGGSQTGLRQAWLRMEIQLQPGQAAGQDAENPVDALVFFGSAALYYEMNQ